MLHTEDDAEILICDRSNGKIIYPIVYTEKERSEYSSAFVNNANWEIMIRTPVAKMCIRDSGYTVNHIFMVWCQGEADADKIYSGSQSAASYKSQTLNVFEYMKTVGVTDTVSYTHLPEETVTPTENPIQTSNPQSTPKADVERKVLYEEDFENCTVGDKASGNSTSVDAVSYTHLDVYKRQKSRNIDKIG